MGMIGFLHSTPSPKLTPQVHYGALRAGDKRQDQARALHPLGLVGKKNTGRTGGCVASGGGGRQTARPEAQTGHPHQGPAAGPCQATPRLSHPHETPSSQPHCPQPRGQHRGVSSSEVLGFTNGDQGWTQQHAAPGSKPLRFAP